MGKRRAIRLAMISVALLSVLLASCSPDESIQTTLPDSTVSEAESTTSSSDFIITGQLSAVCVGVLQDYFAAVEPMVGSVDWEQETPDDFVQSDLFEDVIGVAEPFRLLFDDCSSLTEIVFDIGDLKVVTSDDQLGVQGLLDFVQHSNEEFPELAASWCPGFPIWPR